MTSAFVIISIIVLDAITLKGIIRGFPQFFARCRRGLRIAFIVQSAVAAAIVLGGLFQRYVDDYRLIALYYHFFGAVAAIYIPKAAYAALLFADLKIKATSRLRLAKYGLWACMPFVLLVVWGILFGRYNFTVEQVELTSDSLPHDFDGYKIVQLSDIHTGSFAGAAHRFKKAVDLVNEQKPDLIVMTGDIVNNFADELTAFIPVFSQLKAVDGKYAVLGNHDYGGYFKWKNPADSVANINAIKSAIVKMGFVLLNNQATTISRYDTNHIALIGVENWGILKRFPKRADLKKAMEPVNDMPFKIVLAHDPSFWTKEIKDKSDVALTLTGHTHGMQMGVKIGNKRYGPAPLFPRFRYWAGLYQGGNQYLYVNRGLGVIGFPARIGMPPEITVITLRN